MVDFDLEHFLNFFSFIHYLPLAYYPQIFVLFRHKPPPRLTLKLGQQALAVGPLQLEDVEADEILQVHENKNQGVELIRQPEVRKLHSVKRRREHAKLPTEGARGRKR